jgi:acetyl esterase
MSLSAEVRELLSWDADLGRRLDGLSYAEQRPVVLEVLAERARSTGLRVADVAAVADHAIPVAGGELRLRVYTPEGDGPHPLFFHVHGGGFVGGSIDLVYNAAKCAHICAGTGCVVTTVEYRLAPEFPFPTAPEDCYAALLWVVEHAQELGVDPERIVVGGESAGGNLAAVLAQLARDRGGPRLALQLLEVPVADMSAGSALHPSLALYGEGFGLDRTGIDAFIDAYLPDPADRELPYASPLCAADLAGLAPAHVVTAELDPLRDGGEAYARRLEQAGVTTTVRRFEGQTHGSSSLWQTWAPAGAWMDAIVAAIAAAVSSTGAAHTGC